MVGLQTLDLAIGVRVPASQPTRFQEVKGGFQIEPPFLWAYSVPIENFGLIVCQFS
jgi:hypothetical protein